MSRLIKRKLGRRVERAGTVTMEMKHHLRAGFDYTGRGFGGYGTDRPLDLDAAREAWEQCGDEILAEYVEHFPGQRPWPFWRFDYPNQKQCRECRDEIDDAGCGCGGCHTETDYEFLSRRGMLTDAEAEKIDRSIHRQYQLGILNSEEFHNHFRLKGE